VDEGSFQEMDAKLDSVNALGFKGYLDKVKAYQSKTGLGEAVVTGRAKIESLPVLLAVMDFRFLGASMGSVVGEKITRAIESATAERKPVIVFSASGGARMHEGILSLMQMAKTSGALARHAEARLPYISVLTHPTTGGVTASFATLGDLIIAEPKCMIGFAGPRVVKETTHADLPPGFQTAEFMLQHGLVDMIVERKDMRATLAKVLRYMMK
jgi:acetyl-CoA carboxylase carboxyl transferase subunit beta